MRNGWIAFVLLAFGLAGHPAHAQTWYFSLDYTQTLITACPGGNGLGGCTYAGSGASSITQQLDGTMTGFVTIDSHNHLSDFALHDQLVVPDLTYLGYPNWGLAPQDFGGPVGIDITPANGTASIYSGPGVSGTVVQFNLTSFCLSCQVIGIANLALAFTIGADLNTDTGSFAFAPVVAWNETMLTSLVSSQCGTYACYGAENWDVFRDLSGGVVTDSAPLDTPEPLGVALLGTALAAFAMVRRRVA